MSPAIDALDRPVSAGGPAFSLSGKGFSTGRDAQVVIRRSPAGVGGWVRIGGAGMRRVSGKWANAPFTGERCTKVHGVGPLEHLAAALVVAGESGWCLDSDSPDLPLLDGSARAWAGLLSRWSDRFPADIRAIPLSAAIHLRSERGWIEATPSDHFDLDVRWSDGPDGPERWRGGREELPNLLGARTFARADVGWEARRAGRMLGVDPGSGRLLASRRPIPREAREELESRGVRCDGPVWTGGGERMPGECAAHKALDLIGDMAIALGYLPEIRITARDAGHSLHAALGRAMRERF